MNAAPPVPGSVIAAAVDQLAEELLAARGRGPDGLWRGRLSSSALATATAISALAAAGEADAAPIERGAAWLRDDQNGDGGWGDSPESPSNLSTSLLALAALRLSRMPAATATARAEAYVAGRAGSTPEQRCAALQRIYGEDRTFAVPILMNLAIAGLVPWRLVPSLPFTLAAMPAASYRLLRLRVVSYALPALIAIGARLAHEQGRSGWLTRWARPRALKKLPLLQPPHGGFLDAMPLTSFVAMALAGLPDRPGEVLPKCLSFLRSRQREDGSWPIDTDLSIWLTTASVAALASAKQLHRLEPRPLVRTLLAAQHRELHPYTQAAPGGWAWTDHAGGVPDADDTSGAILALCGLAEDFISTSAEGRVQIGNGLRWLLNLQNGDGGFPTFCRGWGKLPFDQSAPEVTAHAIRAMVAGRNARLGIEVETSLARALGYLSRTQDEEGAWTPLWFGSQLASGHTNRVIGTARVLRALECVEAAAPSSASSRLQSRAHIGARAGDRAVAFLLRVQQADGGWGADAGIEATVEETALAVSALAAWKEDPQVGPALQNGVRFLLRARAAEALGTPAPIGLYFASLWYSEKLYPLVWTLEALGRMRA